MEEIFAHAAALPAAERAAWLDAACAGQPELRAEVEALLRSHEAGGFMKGEARRPEIEAELAAGPRTLKEAREALERDYVQRALRRHNGKISPAAADLGISRPTFYELMEKLGIQKDKDAKDD